MNKGFTTLEFVIGSVLLATSLSASVSLYSSVAKRNQVNQMKNEVSDRDASLRRTLLTQLKLNWMKLGAAACKSEKVSLNINPSIQGSYNLNLMDRSRLNKLLPEKLGNGTENPLRKGIQNLISKYKDKAALKCSDSAALKSDKSLAIIAASSSNQQLCKCATAITPYGTLQDASAEVKNQVGFYSCVQIEKYPASQSASSDMVIESILSITNTATGTAISCKDLGKLPNGFVSKLDYFSFVLGKPSSDLSAYIKLPGTLVME